jgi:C4-dicarboxylate-specific signal transduction histidine kinase
VGAALTDITSDAQRVSRMVGTMQRLLIATQEPPADIDVRELVDECLVEMRTEMFAQRVSCDVQTAPHLPGIRGIRRQLVQMLVNLVTNSLEAMDRISARERRLALRALLHDPRTIEISAATQRPGARHLPQHHRRAWRGHLVRSGAVLRRRLQGATPGQ